jgi:selenide,water dikinase
VLVGVGHTHAEIVRRWHRRPIAGAELTCVSDAPVATYSGMLPGVLAGQYRPDDLSIDLPRLCQRSGVRLIVGDVRAFDARTGELSVGDAPLSFDVASIGVGSVPSMAGVVIDDGAPLVAVKPMRSFLGRLDAQLSRTAGGARVCVAVVGAGAGGIEIAFTLLPFLRARVSSDTNVQVALVAGPDGPTPGQWPGTTRRVLAALARKGIAVVNHRATRVTKSHLECAGGGTIEIDAVIWATGAVAPPLLGTLGLPTDGLGFLLTAVTLRTTGGGPVFAVGDSGTVVGVRAAKAGVHAVRHAPVLWDNLRRTLTGAPLRRYRPRPHFLRLLNTGDGRAIGEWRGRSFEGTWAWWLKDRIDRRFIARYRVG